MKNFSLILVLVSCMLLFNACLKEAETDPPSCDTFPDVSFTNDIVTALDGFGCYGCHSASAAPYSGNNIVLEGYTAFSAEAERVFGSISGDAQYAQMPLGNPGVVDANTIQQVECWILRGKNDN